MMQANVGGDYMAHQTNPVALIPAAGSADRLPGISGSKEMLEVAVTPTSEHYPILQHLLTHLAVSSLRQIVLITSPDKQDILDYLGRAGAETNNVAIELISNSRSVVHTLSGTADHFTRDSIFMALPDILFRPGQAITELLNAWPTCQADLLLGLFPTDRPEKSDIVETDANGGVVRIRIKESAAANGYAWIMAMWTPVFTRFLSKWLSSLPPENNEPQLGEVFNAAITAGLNIDSIRFPAGGFLDIGTPDDLQRLRSRGLDTSDEPVAD
jgi:glucose-1-phosphate thymidylyltransferase